MSKYLSLLISDSSLERLSEYLYKNHFCHAVLGFTLSFGSFSCEVRATSLDIHSLAISCMGEKNEKK